MTTALNGIKVLDLSRVLAGPWCTMTLADLGADVIKVESLKGDDTRAWGPPFIGEGEKKISAYFACCNRNKRSLAIDISTPQGLEIIHKLVKTADVVVENYKTGGAEKLGVGYTTLSAINPQLIYCSISGYGRTGSHKDHAGYDFIIQAEAGLMSITGEEHGEPTKVGVAITDIMTGQNATTAILAALINRSNTGKGQRIDISLFETQIQALANVASNVLFTNQDAPRFGNGHPNIVPYQAFKAKDNWFAVAIGNDKQWQNLTNLIGKPEWAEENTPYATNPNRVKNRAELIPQLAAIFVEKTVTYWLEAMAELVIPCGRINSVAEALDHPAANNLIINKGVPMLGSPLHLSATPVSYNRPPPLCGEHNAEILAEIK